MPLLRCEEAVDECGHIGDVELAVEVGVGQGGGCLCLVSEEQVDEGRNVGDVDDAVTVHVARVLDGHDGLEVLPMDGRAIGLEGCPGHVQDTVVVLDIHPEGRPVAVAPGGRQ